MTDKLIVVCWFALLVPLACGLPRLRRHTKEHQQ